MFKRIVTIFLIIAILFSGLWFFSSPIKGLFHFVFAPLEKVFYRIGDSASDVVAGFFRAKQINEEKQIITNKYFELLKETTSLKLLESENELLRQLTKVGLAEEFDLAISEVAAYSTDKNSIFITSAPADIFKKGMPVITKEGVLVGRVEQTFGNFTRVSLISSPNFIFDVVIHSPVGEIDFNSSLTLSESTGAVLGALEGQGNSQLTLGLVLKEEKIKRDDIILTTTLGGNFPKGLLVGKIDELIKSDTEPFYRGTVNPFFLNSDLNYLFIITNFEALGGLE